MGLLTRTLGIRNLSLEDPAQALLPYSSLFESLGLGRSDAGVMVNEKQAMRLTTVYACIKVISEDLSSLPLSVFQRMPDGTVREAVEHPMYALLHDAPSPMMTSMVYRGSMLWSALGWGNSYSLIRRDRAARVVSLHPLPSDRTSPILVNGELAYATTATEDGSPARIDAVNMLHVMGSSLDGGFTGVSPIQLCKNAYGLGLAAEKFGAQFFGNGAKASGVLSHPETLETEAYERLKQSVREMATGDNALVPIILEEGMKWEQMSIAPNDAQFLQTRQFQVEEVARIYRVAMHLLQSLQRATNNNIEHQSLDHIRYTLRPWAVRIEQEINRKLLKGSFFCEHDFNAFQRGDFASQTTGYRTLLDAGVYDVDEVRLKLRENPIGPEEGGSVRRAPLNMTTLKTLMQAEAAPQQAALPAPGDPPAGNDGGAPGEVITDQSRGHVVQAFRRLFRDVVGRVVNRKAPDVQFAQRALHPVLASMAEAVLAMHLPGAPELSESQSQQVSAYAAQLAAGSAGWTTQTAAATATALTDEAYTALQQALIGA